MQRRIQQTSTTADDTSSGLRGSRLRKSGFALVATLSILVLLALVAIGLLSLSTIVVRTTSHDKAHAEARANARLAMMLAIGELQKELGPDQRISARAEVLDRDASSESADSVAHPYYLGAWDSWDTWLTDRKGSLSIQDTYKRGRDPSLFRGWLVSHRDAGAYETAINATPSSNAIMLASTGPRGTEEEDRVFVDRIPLRQDDRSVGTYAWWVSDESMKARIDLIGREKTDSLERAMTVSSHTGRTGVETLPDMDGFNTDAEAIPKMITLGQAALSAPAARQHFHDLTSYSLGLLTDVRSGGFKGDLNLAFESSKIPEEMDQAEIFSGRPYDAPIRPLTGDLAQIAPQNPYVAPMSWRQLREYYRLYREFPGSEKMHPIEWNGGTPVTRRFLMGSAALQNKWDTEGYTRLPVMLRQTWIIATKSESNPSAPDGRDYYILAVPIVSLWNPFDITMHVDSEEISYFGSMFYATAMRQRTYRGSTLLRETRFPDEESWNGGRPNHDITANQLGYRMIPTEKGGSLITFEPGQVRIFSTDDEILHGVKLIDSNEGMASRHFFASPGYSPVQDSNTRVLRGLKNKINAEGTGSGPLGLSLRLAVADRTIDPFWVGASRKSTIAFSFQEVLAAKHGVYFDNGNLVGKQEWHDVARLQVFSLDWLRGLGEVNKAWIIRDEPAYRASWPPPGSPPLPVGIFSIVAKSPERLAYESSAPFAKDFRNRGWLHAPPTGMGAFLMNPTDLNRADSAYQLHFTPVNGDQEVSQWLQADGDNGYFGGGYTPASGQTHVSALDLPVAPIVNLGAFASVRIDPARCRLDQSNDNKSNPRVNASALPGRGYHNLKHQAHNGAAFGAGIGNGYAHPMIEPSKVYTRNDFDVDLGWEGSNATFLPITDDYWDHLFLANEGLWDSWFCSGIVPEVKRGRVETPAKTVAENFFSGEDELVSPHFLPYLRGKTAEEAAKLIEANSSPGRNGWDVVGSYMMNKGQFNVNSTSKEAWKALLMTLAQRPLALNDAENGIGVISPGDEITLSRHPLANSKGVAGGPLDESAWQGIRTLQPEQVDKLAEEIVRQVKLRGPFLNMSEFINRRLDDEPTGVTGALQAAIDWDEFEAGYNGTTSGTGERINEPYKDSESMFTTGALPADYPHPEAATGSRYAGIPGYVMQSDLLQGLGTSLTVRGDTFLVRAYGESLRPDGTVAAAAWCEAVVQRFPEFVDPSDEADKKMRFADKLPNDRPELHPLNEAFGRQFRITSFRWLNRDEV